MNSFQEESQGGRWRMGGVSKQDWNMQKIKIKIKDLGWVQGSSESRQKEGVGMATC